MMLSLLFEGHVAAFVIILLAIVFSLTFHEVGHALAAKAMGDDTAERLGRITLNPVPHIDPIGLLMVMTVGFGFAKPVPFNPNNMKYPWSSALVALAGPMMNLLLAVIAANVLAWALVSNAFEMTEIRYQLLSTMIIINLLLMLFNLIPLGALDGHYIMPWLLPRDLAIKYEQFNMQYGNMVFMGLIVMSIAGLPIFAFLQKMIAWIVPYITFVSLS